MYHFYLQNPEILSEYLDGSSQDTSTTAPTTGKHTLSGMLHQFAKADLCDEKLHLIVNHIVTVQTAAGILAWCNSHSYYRPPAPAAIDLGYVSAGLTTRENIRICSCIEILGDNLCFLQVVQHVKVPWVYSHVLFDMRKQTPGRLSQGYTFAVTPDSKCCQRQFIPGLKLLPFSFHLDYHFHI